MDAGWSLEALQAIYEVRYLVALFHHKLLTLGKIVFEPFEFEVFEETVYSCFAKDKNKRKGWPFCETFLEKQIIKTLNTLQN